MKKWALFVVQSLLIFASMIFFLTAGLTYASGYSVSRELLFLKMMMQFCFIATILYIISISMQIVRVKKYFAISKRVVLAGIHFLIFPFVAICWFMWILGGLLEDIIPEWIPIVYLSDEIEMLRYHVISASIFLVLSIIYCLIFFVSEHRALSKVTRLTIKSQDPNR